MLIRPATPDDGPAYLDLVRSLANFEHLEPPTAEACERLMDHAFSDPPRYRLWVAEDEAAGAIVAYAATFNTYSTFLAQSTLHLEDLFVAPHARRRGIATAMLTFLRDRAERDGCGRFEWFVLSWNTGAQALYENVGAELLDDWRLMRVQL